jgi:exopolyphosphatase/guanosine-5'-triphosphate,3'-diphosphate pyrophosphatase
VALAGYAEEIEALGAERIRMVATSASRRRAANDRRVPRHVLVATLGIAPEVVTGEEEARLSFTGAVRGLPTELPPPYLVVDIGGGSTEFVLGDRDVRAARSAWTSAASG